MKLTSILIAFIKLRAIFEKNLTWVDNNIVRNNSPII